MGVTPHTGAWLFPEHAYVHVVDFLARTLFPWRSTPAPPPPPHLP